MRDGDVLSLNKRIYRYCKNINLVDKLSPNTGTMLVVYGALLGYKNIYTTGIDFYESNSYLYNIGKDIKDNVLYGNMDLRLPFTSDAGHSVFANLKLLNYIFNVFNQTNFYSLNLDSRLGSTCLNSMINQEKDNFLRDIEFMVDKKSESVLQFVDDERDCCILDKLDFINNIFAFNNYKQDRELVIKNTLGIDDKHKISRLKQFERFIRRKIKKKLGFSKYQ